MSQPESRLVRNIRVALEARGAFAFKIHGSSTMMAGLPDLIVCYKGYFIGIEAKMPGNKPSRRQELVHAWLRGAGGIVVVAYSVEDATRALDVCDQLP